MTISYRMKSVVVGTLAEILAVPGLYTYQEAVATDFNDCRLYWNGTVWKWAKVWQKLAKFRTPVTAPVDLLENTIQTYTLPALGANDEILVEHFWTTTNNANAKTAKVNLGALPAGTGWAVDLANNNVHNMVTHMRNMNDASSQKWQSNNKSIFGSTSSLLQSTTRATGTAGVVLTITLLKATVAGDSVVLDYADISILGGG